MIFTGDKIIEVWSKEDVEYLADKRGVTLTEDQLNSVMVNMVKYHDCSVGCNWDFIDICLDMVLKEGTSPDRVIEATITPKEDVWARIYGCND